MGKRVQGKLAAGLLFVAGFIGFIFFLMWNRYCTVGQYDNSMNCDLNGDGAEEIIRLTDSCVTVSHENVVIWESDAEWEVTDFLVADINRDDREELLLLAWKKGSFGEYTPFWEENDEEYSQHIFIYRMSEDKMQAVWMSSRLKPQVQSWNMTEDGLIHIVTDSGEDTDWMWGEWGLERVR